MAKKKTKADEVPVEDVETQADSKVETEPEAEPETQAPEPQVEDSQPQSDLEELQLSSPAQESVPESKRYVMPRYTF